MLIIFMAPILNISTATQVTRMSTYAAQKCLHFGHFDRQVTEQQEAFILSCEILPQELDQNRSSNEYVKSCMTDPVAGRSTCREPTK